MLTIQHDLQDPLVTSILEGQIHEGEALVPDPTANRNRVAEQVGKIPLVVRGGLR
jgi:hypothetical protein